MWGLCLSVKETLFGLRLQEHWECWTLKYANIIHSLGQRKPRNIWHKEVVFEKLFPMLYFHKLVTDLPFQQKKENTITLSLLASCCPLQPSLNYFTSCFISAPLSGLEAGRSEATGCPTDFFHQLCVLK